MSTLLTESALCDLTTAELDLRDLQVRFAELFDRAARALHAQGLDQDDVVFDRFLVCEVAGRRVDVTVKWLADRQRLISHVRQEIGESVGSRDPEGTRFCELKVVVRRDDRPTTK